MMRYLFLALLGLLCFGDSTPEYKDIGTSPGVSPVEGVKTLDNNEECPTLLPFAALPARRLTYSWGPKRRRAKFPFLLPGQRCHKGERQLSWATFWRLGGRFHSWAEATLRAKARAKAKAEARAKAAQALLKEGWDSFFETASVGRLRRGPRRGALMARKAFGLWTRTPEGKEAIAQARADWVKENQKRIQAQLDAELARHQPPQVVEVAPPTLWELARAAKNWFKPAPAPVKQTPLTIEDQVELAIGDLPDPDLVLGAAVVALKVAAMATLAYFWPEAGFGAATAAPLLTPTTLKEQRSSSKQVCELRDFVQKTAKSADYIPFPTVRVGIGANGTAAPGATCHEIERGKGKVLTLIFSSEGGLYTPQFVNLAEDLGVELTQSDVLLYEMEDANSTELHELWNRVMAEQGWVVLCKGLAVRLEKARPFLDFAGTMFPNLVEVRSYFRSLLTTPNVADHPRGLPVVRFDGALIAWGEKEGNDGGGIHTAGVLGAHQPRGKLRDRSEKSASRSIWKGFSSDAKLVLTFKGGLNLYNYTDDEVVNGLVKQIVRTRNSQLSRYQIMNRLIRTTSGREMIKTLPNIGPRRLDALVDEHISFGDWKSDDDLKDSCGWLFNEKADATWESLRWCAAVPVSSNSPLAGEVISLGVFFELGMAKGRDKKKGQREITLLGHTGQSIDVWAIAQDRTGSRIRLGWQVIQLLSPEDIGELMSAGATKKMKKKVQALMESKHSMLESLIQTSTASGNDNAADMIEAAMKVIGLMSGFGKRAVDHFSNGMGLTADSRYVQMIDLGGDYVIGKLPSPGDAFKRAFLARTPNQGHETINHPIVMSPRFFGDIVTEMKKEEGQRWQGKWLREENRDKLFAALEFVTGLKKACGDNDSAVMLRLMTVKAMLPAVVDGVIIVDSTLQAKVAGDNDGDRNMISFDPVLVRLAEKLAAKHPATTPAKEQSKKYALNTFHDAIVDEGANRWLEALDDQDLLVIINQFLGAAGNTPGQGNVGGATQVASVALGFHPWEFNDKGQWEPMNRAARRFMDICFLLQQILIDQQKYNYCLVSLLYWFLSDLYAGGGTIKELRPGKPESSWSASHYPIFGAEDLTFSQYKECWKNRSFQELIPEMGGSRQIAAHNGATLTNAALYHWAAWNMSLINLGFGYAHPDQMRALQPFFTKEGTDWEKAASYLKKSVDEVKAAWVTPKMVTGWFKTTFKEAQGSDTPAAFKAAREAAAKVFAETIENAGISDPFQDLREGDDYLEKIFKEHSGQDWSSIPDWAYGRVLKALYGAYVDSAQEEAQGMAQSEKTQSDQQASSSDKLRHLRAAASAARFDGAMDEYASLAGIHAQTKTWAPALRNEGVSNERRWQILSGIFYVALRGIRELAVTNGEVEEKVDILHSHLEAGWTLEDIANLTPYEAWQAWRQQNDATAKNSLEAMKNRQQVEKLREIALNKALFQKIENLTARSKDNLIAAFIAANEEGGDARIVEWVTTEVFPALDEAWKRQDAVSQRAGILEELKTLVANLKQKDLNEVLEYSLREIEEYAESDIINALNLAAQAAEIDLDQYWKLYKVDFMRSYQARIRPVVSLHRLIKWHLPDALAADYPHEELWLNVEASLFGTHNQYNADAREWQEVEHVAARIEYTLPRGMVAQQILGILQNGVDVLALGKVHKGGAYLAEDADPQAMKQEDLWVNRTGWLHFSSLLTLLALRTESEQDYRQYIECQLEHGVGHVYSAGSLLDVFGPEALGKTEDNYAWLFEDRPARWGGVAAGVAQTCQNLMRESVILHFEVDEDTRGQYEGQDDDALKEMQEEHLFFPPLYGARSSFQELIFKEDDQGNEKAVTMYSLLRSFFFMQEGADMRQPTPPAPVKALMEECLEGKTISAGAGSQRSFTADRKTDRARGLHERSLRRARAAERSTPVEQRTNLTKAALDKSLVGVDSPFTQGQFGLPSFEHISTKAASRPLGEFKERWKSEYALMRLSPSLLWAFDMLKSSTDYKDAFRHILKSVRSSTVRPLLSRIATNTGEQALDRVEVITLKHDYQCTKELFELLASWEIPVHDK